MAIDVNVQYGVVDAMPLGANASICDPGRYRMARGWRYTKLSLSSAHLLAYASCYCSFLFDVFVLCSRWSFVDFSYLSLSSRPRTGLATMYIAGYG